MTLLKKIDLSQFRQEQPSLRTKPSNYDGLVLEGLFFLNAQVNNHPKINESFHLRIQIPNTYPKKMIEVRELRSKIPKTGEYHVNPDNTFCLGSPLRLRMLVSGNNTLSHFIEKCLVPYLYAISLKLLNYRTDLLFGELAHGDEGQYDEYRELFGLESQKQIDDAFLALSKRKRVANKMKCPCGCNKRIGKCNFRFRLHEIRKLIPRKWVSENIIK